MKRVIDASMTTAALFPSQQRPGALALLGDSRAELIAPAILRQEFLHALLRTERRFAADRGTAARTLADFEALEITYFDSDAWPRRAYELARELGTGLFDTIYLVAAEDLDAELWTLDQRFLRALGGRYAERVRTLA